MTCSACSARVEKVVSNIDGIQACSVNLLTNSMQVKGDVDSATIIEAVEKAGYKPGDEFKIAIDAAATEMYEEAKKKGEELKLEETEEFAKIIANAKRDILAQMAMREVLGGITVTEEFFRAFAFNAGITLHINLNY